MAFGLVVGDQLRYRPVGEPDSGDDGGQGVGELWIDEYSRSVSVLDGMMCSNGTTSPVSGSRYCTKLWWDSSSSSSQRMPVCLFCAMSTVRRGMVRVFDYADRGAYRDRPPLVEWHLGAVEPP
ncbi:hypothetical protein [Dactylosporangium sp. NPDC048998]|uniref:hypothetical protein n=1 Tax=Dactylosporangium sp. NPDC048998 TaxID=3363976 RepID=UPI00371F556C